MIAPDTVPLIVCCDEEGTVAAKSVIDLKLQLDGPKAEFNDDLKVEPSITSRGAIYNLKANDTFQDIMHKLEPNDVSQVLVGQSLIPGQYTFKTAYGKYLTSDSLGKVLANRDAVGPSEEWIPIKTEAGFALQNVHGKFLSVDRESGRVRADSESTGFAETFQIRCHASKKRVSKRVYEEQAEDYDLDSIELEQAYLDGNL